MNTFDLQIVCLDEVIFSGNVEYVIMKSDGGELGIYSKHTPLLTKIVPGSLRFKPENKTEEKIYYISGGFAEVLPEKTLILADSFERTSDLDKKNLEEMRAKTEKELENHSFDSYEHKRLLQELKVHTAKINVLRSMK